MRKRTFLLLYIFLFCLQLSLPVWAIGTEQTSPTSYIVQLKSPLPTPLSLSDEKTFYQEISAAHGLYVIEDYEIVELLQEEGLVRYAEPDYEVELFTEDSLAPFTASVTSASWPLDMLGTAYGNTLGCFGQGIRVGIIDSGAYAHDDLSANLLPGYNFLSDTTDVTDNIGHGTFVAGLIAAMDNGWGVTGVAPAAQILPLKCFDTGATTKVSMICRAIYAAVDEYDCQILNMSFGVKSYSETFAKAIQYAADQGVIAVASAGNEGTAQLYYPAAFPSVIGVGAVNDQKTVAYFSQRNDSVLITAPGQAVYSTSNAGDYTLKSGTSFSAPMVVGLLARMLNADPTLTPQAAAQVLTTTAIDLGDEGYDTAYGYGLVSLPEIFSHLLFDTPYFLAPLSKTAGTLSVSFFNNTAEPFFGQCFFSEYKKGLMIAFDWQDLYLQPGDAATIFYPATQNETKCYLWHDLSNITVITPYQDSEGSS